MREAGGVGLWPHLSSKCVPSRKRWAVWWAASQLLPPRGTEAREREDGVPRCARGPAGAPSLRTGAKQKKVRGTRGCGHGRPGLRCCGNPSRGGQGRSCGCGQRAETRGGRRPAGPQAAGRPRVSRWGLALIPALRLPRPVSQCACAHVLRVCPGGELQGLLVQLPPRSPSGKLGPGAGGAWGQTGTGQGVCGVGGGQTGRREAREDEDRQPGVAVLSRFTETR